MPASTWRSGTLAAFEEIKIVQGYGLLSWSSGCDSRTGFAFLVRVSLSNALVLIVSRIVAVSNFTLLPITCLGGDHDFHSSAAYQRALFPNWTRLVDSTVAVTATLFSLTQHHGPYSCMANFKHAR